jgi:NADH-quinone oxidoreductase subunit H
MAIDLNLAFRVLVFPGFVFIIILTLICDWIARKIGARMQNRMGPSYTGLGGFLQPLADFIKLLTKESTAPDSANKFIFKVAPLLSFTLFVFAMFFMPIDGNNVIPGSDFNGDLILVLILVSIANFVLFLAGWSSNNPYSKIGGSRVLLQVLGYDIPFFIVAMMPSVLASTSQPAINNLSLTGIVASQLSLVPFAILIPWAFLLFIISMQAELEMKPFDIPHAETEIVGGYETEYNGASLAFLKLGKDVQLVFGSFLIVELFLGGPTGPGQAFIGSQWIPLWDTIWFVIKVIIIVIVVEYVANLFGRIRIDQVMTINWRVLMPLSIIGMVATLCIAYLIPAISLGLSIVTALVGFFVVLVCVIYANRKPIKN